MANDVSTPPLPARRRMGAEPATLTQAQAAMHRASRGLAGPDAA